jgi:hypothetical protein
MSELNEMIEALLQSDIVENKELGVSLLRSDEVSDEEKRKYIDGFIQDYIAGKIDSEDPEVQNLFKGWVEIYLAGIKNEVRNRIQKIE